MPMLVARSGMGALKKLDQRYKCTRDETEFMVHAPNKLSVRTCLPSLPPGPGSPVTGGAASAACMSESVALGNVSAGAHAASRRLPRNVHMHLGKCAGAVRHDQQALDTCCHACARRSKARQRNQGLRQWDCSWLPSTHTCSLPLSVA